LGESRAEDDTGASVDDDDGDCRNDAGIEAFLSLSYDPSIDKLDF